MKTMGKIIAGVLIVGVIYMYMKNNKTTMKKDTKTKDISVQTDSLIDEPILKDELYVIEAEEYIQKEESLIEEVKQLTSNSISADVEQVEEHTHIEEVSSPVSQNDGIRNMSVIELKELAKEQNVKGYSRMKKAELIEILS